MKFFKRTISIFTLALVLVLNFFSPVEAGQYIVKPGDYLSKIAPKYNTHGKILLK